MLGIYVCVVETKSRVCGKDREVKKWFSLCYYKLTVCVCLTVQGTVVHSTAQ